MLLLVFCQNYFAQAPQGIQYQAIARDFSGNPIPNQNISVKFDIHDNTPLGTVVFSETHTGLTTNSFGLFNMVIGTQNPSGFQSINWGSGSKFIETSIDAGTGFVSISNTQLMSVPYALYAESSGNAGTNLPQGINGQILNYNGTAWDSTSAILINPAFILANKKFGIGTIPGFPFSLDVVGNSRVTGLSLADSIRTNNFRMLNGAGSGKVLTSDLLGNASWQIPSGNSGTNLPQGINGQILNYNGTAWDSTSAILINPAFILANKKIGIGTVPGSPFSLDVVGNSRVTGLSLADSIRTNNLRMINGSGSGKVLTSDLLGNASWQTLNQNFWGLNGNAGTNAGNFIGTTDAVPLQFFTKGSQRIFIDTLGRVGIGNANPSYLLHSAKTSSLNNDFTGVFDMISFATGSAYGIGGNIYGTGSGSFTGILATATGTSTGTITGIVSQVTGNGNGDKIGIKSKVVGSGGKTIGIQSLAKGVINDTTISIYSNGTGSPHSFALYTDTGKVYFKDSVGIGVFSPTAKLDVNGNAWIRNNLKVSTYTLPNTNGANGQVLTTLGNGATAWTSPGPGGTILPNANTGQFLFYNGTAWDSINRNNLFYNIGNNFFGIGTTNPNSNLEIYSNNPSLGIINNSGFGSSTLDLSNNTGTSASLRYDHGSNRMYFKTNSSDRMYLDGAGNLVLGNLNSISSGLNLGQNMNLVFEGNTNNSISTILNATDPTSNRLINLPDASGTLLLDPTSVSGDMIIRSGTSTVALPVGSLGDVLNVGPGNIPTWAPITSLLPAPQWIQAGTNISTAANINQVGIATSNVTSTLTVNGTFALSNIYTAPNGSFTLTVSASDPYSVFLIPFNGISINLPIASAVPGRIYTIKQIGISTLTTTIQSTGCNVEGTGTYTLTGPIGSGITLISDGANWWIIGKI